MRLRAYRVNPRGWQISQRRRLRHWLRGLLEVLATFKEVRLYKNDQQKTGAEDTKQMHTSLIIRGLFVIIIDRKSYQPSQHMEPFQKYSSPRLPLRQPAAEKQDFSIVDEHLL